MGTETMTQTMALGIIKATERIAELEAERDEARRKLNTLRACIQFACDGSSDDDAACLVATRMNELVDLRARCSFAESDRATLLRVLDLRDSCYICGASLLPPDAVPHCEDTCSVSSDGECDYGEEWRCEHRNGMKAVEEIRRRVGS